MLEGWNRSRKISRYLLRDEHESQIGITIYTKFSFHHGAFVLDHQRFFQELQKQRNWLIAFRVIFRSFFKEEGKFKKEKRGSHPQD